MHADQSISARATHRAAPSAIRTPLVSHGRAGLQHVDRRSMASTRIGTSYNSHLSSTKRSSCAASTSGVRAARVHACTAQALHVRLLCMATPCIHCPCMPDAYFQGSTDPEDASASAAWAMLKDFTVKEFQGLSASYVASRAKRDELRKAVLVSWQA